VQLTRIFTVCVPQGILFGRWDQ